MVNGMFNQENYVLAQKMLDASVLRHEALAGNLANINTKGYRRVDVAPSFQSELRSAVSHGKTADIRRVEAEIEVDQTARSVRGDGNNVEMDSELMKMSNNALEYEFLTQYTSNSLARLKSAIAGRTS